MNKNIFFNFFFNISDKVVFVIMLLCLSCLFLGLLFGFFFAPSDYLQKDAFRIMYVHVPSAYMSILIYVIISFFSILYFFGGNVLFDFIADSSSKIGALFTFIALVTGSIWGKPMWGTWWVWDARLTSELILLFLYLGYIGLRNSINNKHLAANVCSILNLVGTINIPIIHYSVEWWYTLHQKSMMSKFGNFSISSEMLLPLIFILIGFFLFYLLSVIISVKNEVLLIKYNGIFNSGFK